MENVMAEETETLQNRYTALYITGPCLRMRHRPSAHSLQHGKFTEETNQQINYRN